LDTGFISERLFEELSQNNAYILNRMMIVDLDIPICLHFQVEQTVAREKREHVIEKGYARFDSRFPRSINIQASRYFRLFSDTFGRSYSLFSHRLMVSLSKSI